MGFEGQKVWGQQEIFLVSGAVSRAWNQKYFLSVYWLCVS